MSSSMLHTCTTYDSRQSPDEHDSFDSSATLLDTDGLQHVDDFLEAEWQDEDKLLSQGTKRAYGDRQDCPTASTSWQMRSASSRAYASAWVRCGLVVLLIVLLLVANPFGGWSGTTRDLSGLAETHDTDKCNDPWRLPGYVWYGKTTRDVRYIRYKSLDELVDSNATSSLSPETNFDLSHANSLPADLPLPVQLRDLFGNARSRQNHTEELNFMRNKHIVALGSSLDREAISNFCNHHGAKIQYKHHRWAYCHFDDYNLTVSSWFHFGTHESDWFKGDDGKSAGTTIEQRVNKLFMPLAEKYGKPDLLLFSTGLWDLTYLHTLARRHDPNLALADFEHLTFNELAWHRARLARIIGFLRSTFPDSVLMYRTTTEIGVRRDEHDDEPISIFQLNQSARTLMKILRVPLFNCPSETSMRSAVVGILLKVSPGFAGSELVRGANEHKDVVHFRTDSRPNWIYGEMALWHLKHIVERTQDPQCWMER